MNIFFSIGILTVVILAITGLASVMEWIFPQNENGPEYDEPCEKYPEEWDEEKELSEYERLNSRITDVEQLSHANKHASIEIAGAFDKIEERVDHLATVQMLILKELKKEHHIEPAKDILVTISDLPELKKSKERSA